MVRILDSIKEKPPFCACLWQVYHMLILCRRFVFCYRNKNSDIVFDNIGIFFCHFSGEDTAMASAADLLGDDDLFFDFRFQLGNVGNDTDQTVALRQFLQ